MLTYKEMSLTVYKRDTGEGMVVINAREPTDGSDEGLRWLSFFFTHEEFEGLLTGKLSSCTDISHNVRSTGEVFTFYDLDFPSLDRGVMRVPYVQVKFPAYVQRILRRAVRLTLRRCEPNGDRLTVALPYALRERWLKRYGQGTGNVEFQQTHPEFFEQCSAEGGATFKRCIDNLRAIAINTTWRASDTARVVLSKDWDGFYFRIMTPRGMCTLNGGVINHGRDGSADWSTHT